MNKQMRKKVFAHFSLYKLIYKQLDRENTFVGRPVFGSPSRPASPRHLDIAVPESILHSDQSIVLHLKDQELWDKVTATFNAITPIYRCSRFINFK